MLKLPQILGRRAPARGRHEQPAAGPLPAADPSLLSDIDAAIEALAVPEPAPEEEAPEIASPAQASAPAKPSDPPTEEAGADAGQADFQAGRLYWERHT